MSLNRKWIAIITFAASLVAGTIVGCFIALTIADEMLSEIEEQQQLSATVFSQHRDRVFALSTTLKRIGYVENGDLAEFYYLSCMLLRLELKSLNPEEINAPKEKAYADKVISQASNLLSRLAEEGKCNK